MPPVETESTRPADERPPRSAIRPVEDPRVYLAAERTYLAWLRTSVALMGFGFVIARFALWLHASSEMQGLTPPHSQSALTPFLGFGMVVVGVVVCVSAASRHREYVEALRAGVANPPLRMRWSLGVAAILALVGLAMAIQLLVYSG